MMIIPLETLRTSSLLLSLIRRLPKESAATPEGLNNSTLAAGPSPLKPASPFPATVVITPLETLRIRLLPVSAMYKLPAESTATPVGPFI